LKPGVVTLIELPLVLPPAAAGIALLASLGPNGIVGGLLDDAGLTLVLTTAGVVVAMTFVASPFYLRQAQAAFESLDPRLLEASRTLGASEARTLMRIAIPLARHGLVAGGALAWGRALGEFGATLMFAGSLRGGAAGSERGGPRRRKDRRETRACCASSLRRARARPASRWRSHLGSASQ
jgi:molybdate transport system permease protein